MNAALRIDRLLANLGYGSRREVTPIIKSGRVTVAGATVRDPNAKVAAQDVRLDGEELDHPNGILVMLNKPIGVICSHEPSEGQRAYDLLPSHWEYRNPRVESVGRLDKDTSGLLVLTDDHQLLHRLTSPKHHVVKRYEVTLTLPYDVSLGERLASGTLVLDGESTSCLPASVELVDEQLPTIAMSLTEGRYHQVRRMVAACGNHVDTLRRTHFGPWSLDNLPDGNWTDITRT